ncbi:GGDEF domain-containing protein [Chitinibacteraceae bacterium HSL-7]
MLAELFSVQQLQALIAFSSAMHIGLGLMLAMVWHTRRTSAGFGWWALTEFGIGIAHALILLQTRSPSTVALLTYNSLYMLYPVVYEVGLRRFLGWAPGPWARGGPLLALVSILVFTATTLSGAALHERIVLFTTISSAQLIWLSVVMIEVARTHPAYRIVLALVLTQWIQITLHLARGADHYALLGSGQGGSLAGDVWMGPVLFATVLFSTLRASVDLVLIHIRVEQELQASLRELEQRANRDALSGLASRSFFESCFPLVQAGATRMGRELRLVLIDIDDFKRINDACGHPTGDAVIRALGQALARTLRQDDVAGRMGGDEFAVLLADCSAHDLPVCLSRMRSAFAEELASLAVGRVTLSLGGAVCAVHDDFAAAYHRADMALYAAKSGGRDRCHVWPEQGSAPELLPLMASY